MPILSSSLGTSNAAMPLVNAAALGQAAGFPVVFATLAALNVAVASERTNIAGLGGIWSDGQPLGTAAEAAQGIMRAWNVVGQHARNVIVGMGVTMQLANDTNAVLFGAGAPGNGVGAIGDILIDGSAVTYYTKTGAAAWSAPAGISVAGSGVSAASPAFTGTPTAPTATAGTSTTQLATTAFVTAAGVTLATSTALKAPLASPTLTGTPAAPTATAGTSTTQIATTEFVAVAEAASAATTTAALAGKAPTANPTFTGTVSGITAAMIGLPNADNTSDANKPISTSAATALALKAPLANPTFTGTVSGITAAMVGLGSADNTSDANKPVSTAAATALALKAPLASPTFTGTVNGITAAMVGLGSANNTSDANKPISTAQAAALLDKADLSGGKLLASQVPDLAIAQYLGTVANQTAMLALVGQTGDWCIRSDTGTVFTLSANAPAVIGSWIQMSYPVSPVSSVAGKAGAVTLVPADVGLGNADNTSDASKPISTAAATALALKAPIANPTFTGTVSGVSAAMVGLGSADNTSDANKPISTAAATAIALKAPLASPTFTGTVSGVTAAMVGLGSADNTSDVNKPVSTAAATAIALKADIASPTLTGVPAAPTAAAGTNTTQLATTAFVTAAATPVATGTALVTLSGVAAGAVNLGTFTGVTIPDNVTEKAALQSLETALEGASTPISANTTLTYAVLGANALVVVSGVGIQLTLGNDFPVNARITITVANQATDSAVVLSGSNTLTSNKGSTAKTDYSINKTIELRCSATGKFVLLSRKACLTYAVTLPYTLTDDDDDNTLAVAGTGNLTVPISLRASFGCLVNVVGTTSVLSSGGTLLNGSATTLTRVASLNPTVAIFQLPTANSFTVTGF